MSKYIRDVVLNPERNKKVARYAVENLVMSNEYPGIVFVRQRIHAARLASAISNALVEAGQISATCVEVTGDTPPAVEAELIARLRRRDPTLPCVVATSAWSTGINIPELRWVLLAGQGQAPVGLVQAAGRSTRPKEQAAPYRVISVEDEGLGASYDRQNAQRALHLSSAGYKVGARQFMDELTVARHTADIEEKAGTVGGCHGGGDTGGAAAAGGGADSREAATGGEFQITPVDVMTRPFRHLPFGLLHIVWWAAVIWVLGVGHIWCN